MSCTKSLIQTSEKKRVQRVADVWRSTRLVFWCSFIPKLFPRKDLATAAVLTFLLIPFLPFCWLMFEWDMTPLALPLSHFTVLSSSYVSLSFLNFCHVVLKKAQNSLMAPHGQKNVWRITSFSLHNAWI